MEDSKKYILLYRKKFLGKIVNYFDGPFIDLTEIKNKMLEYKNNTHIIEQIIFPTDASSVKYIDAYKCEKGESIFICFKTRNNSTSWMQFYSPHAAKNYLYSLRNIKEPYIFSSKDIIMRA